MSLAGVMMALRRAELRQAGVKQLQQVLNRRSKGHMAMRVDMWRGEMAEEQQQHELEAVQAGLQHERVTESKGATPIGDVRWMHMLDVS